MKKILLISILFLGTSFYTSLGLSKEMTAYEVMKKVQDQGKKHRYQSFEIRMVIYDKKGNTRERYFNTWKDLEANRSRSTLRFYKPSDVKGTSMLNIKSDSAKENSVVQWIYLPAFKSFRRLSVRDKKGSFMGSDFTNSDIAGRNLSQDTHKMIKKDKKYYWIESTPKEEESYKKIINKINRSVFIPEEIVFYNKKNQKAKTLQNKKLVLIKGIYIVVESVMENHLTQGNTKIFLDKEKIQIGKKTPSTYFSSSSFYKAN